MYFKKLKKLLMKVDFFYMTQLIGKDYLTILIFFLFFFLITYAVVLECCIDDEY